MVPASLRLASKIYDRSRASLQYLSPILVVQYTVTSDHRGYVGRVDVVPDDTRDKGEIPTRTEM